MDYNQIPNAEKLANMLRSYAPQDQGVAEFSPVKIQKQGQLQNNFVFNPNDINNSYINPMDAIASGMYSFDDIQNLPQRNRWE